jgi:glycerol-3-phosphate dehydrogenase (NAD(P)+)
MAALITRGLAEITRLGLALGARAETFMGLSGLGDLVLTASSLKSRNYAFGEALGRGLGVAEASGGKLAEGALTAAALVDLADARGIDMPIARQVAALVAGEVSLDAAITALMSRPARTEV